MLRMLIGQGVLVVSIRHTYKFPQPLTQKNPSPGCIRKDIHPGSAEHLVIKQHKKKGGNSTFDLVEWNYSPTKTNTNKCPLKNSVIGTWNVF